MISMIDSARWTASYHLLSRSQPYSTNELLLMFAQIIDNLRMAAATQQYIFAASLLVGVLRGGLINTWGMHWVDF